jgi:copper resistance protein B
MTPRFVRSLSFASIAGLLLAAGAPAAGQTDPHAGHRQEKPGSAEEQPTPREAPQELPPFIPRPSEADRKAAFPDVQGHTAHDNAVNSFVLFDQVEWQAGEGIRGLNLDAKGWIGRDRDRFWFRAEGDSDANRVGEAQMHLLFGHQFARWWDIVGGIRQDFRPDPAQTWAAIGLQGLAPYWFEIEATAYLGAGGRTQARFEVEYELLLTNRLVLQPLVEVEVSGRSDPERGIGAGLTMTDAGVRLRYEFRREVAPYVGVTWNRKHGKTADFAEAAGEPTGGARFVTGVRLWF